MTLSVDCECGKSYRLADDAAGRRFKCKSCGKILTAPRSPGAEAPVAAGARCPNCGQELQPGAVFCVGCGRNLQTGEQLKAAPTAAAKKPGKQRRPAVPWRLVGPGIVVLGLVLAGWLFLIRPMAARSVLNEALELAEEARYSGAAKMLEESRSKVYGQYAEELEFRVGQMKMQAKYPAGGGPSPQGRSLGMEVFPELDKETGKLLLHVQIVNGGDAPVTLSRKAFYLRGKPGLVPPVGHAEGSLEGVVLEPGATAEGVVAFRKLPGSPLGMVTDRAVKTKELVYNDGVRYLAVHF
jgi:hypothetical protein